MSITRGDTVLRHPIEIMGEPFWWDEEDGWVFICHEQWSLMGRGHSLAEAERDLYEMAVDIQPLYVNEPDDKMTTYARRLRDFIAPIRLSEVPA